MASSQREGAISPEDKEELAFGQVWDGAAQNHTRPKIGEGEGGRRRSSVQFHTTDAEDTIRRESISQAPRSSISQRKSSPPPPSNYQRGVSFDTFDNRDATSESFTLIYKHRDYQSSPRSRTFLCGTDAKDYSEYALEWMIDELVDDGDEIVCLRVVEKDSKIAVDTTLKYRDEAQKLLDSVIKKNASEEKAISMVMELAVGRVQDVFQRMIQIYEPSALVVGTRGRNLGGMQGLLPGSVSKYCLQHSPVPVIVVRPSSKRLKKKRKRQQESGRSLYSSMVEQAHHTGGKHLQDKINSLSPEATKEESAAVAKAIGAPKRGILKGTYGGPLARVTSNKSDGTSGDEEAQPQSFALPMGFLSMETAPKADEAMKSPSIAMLEEDWSSEEDIPKSKPEPPKSPKYAKPPERKMSESAISDTEDGFLGVPKIVEDRRPSTKETTPWLASILGDSKPEKPKRRAPSSGQSPGRPLIAKR